MFYEQHDLSDKNYLKISANINENFSFPLHLHKNCEFIYVEEGILRVGINGCSFDVKSGEGAFILPDQPHEFSTPEHSKSWLAIFSADHIPELNPITGISGAKKFFSPVIRPAHPDLREVLHKAAGNPFRLRSILYEFAALYFEGEPAPEITMEDGALVCKIVEYINAHYTKKLTLLKMSQDLGYSYRYMSGIVNNFFKCTLPQVVNRYRVNYACKLLSDTSEEITEIALLCGFGSIRNFNRSFKAMMGVCPHEYRSKTAKAEY